MSGKTLRRKVRSNNMKHIICTIIICTLVNTNTVKSQLISTQYTKWEPKIQIKYNWKDAILPAVLAGASGTFNGLNQTISHHYPSFKRVFPNASDRFWGPDSWRNKYELGDPTKGPAYLGSTTFLAWTTDGYHLTNTGSRGTLFSAGLTIGIGEKRPWWHYAIDVGVSFIAYSAGFHLVYSGVF